MIRILTGDCRDVLPTLEAASFDCIVTSPPYWGLRSYLPEGHDDKHREIGLEPTLDAYVETMVAVGRELWRVLKPEGTFWLNLGSSYFGSGRGGNPVDSPYQKQRTNAGSLSVAGDKNPSRFRPSSRAQACGIDGTEPLDSTVLDSACFGLDDERQGDSQTHRDRTPGSVLPRGQSSLPRAPTDQHNGNLDSGLRDELSRLSPKALSFLGYAPDDFGRGATSSAYQRQRPRYSADGHLRTERVSGKTDRDMASRMLGKDASETAFGSPSEAFRRYLAIQSRHFKAKDLVDVPHLVALALQADGWWLRSAIVWAKPNTMPESVTDRPTSAYEMVFLLTKAERYFYDAEAISETSDPFSVAHGNKYGDMPSIAAKGNPHRNDNGGRGKHCGVAPGRDTRNARNVWTIATQPFKGSHFATMPPDLAERCIRAGSSEKGCCPQCGSPWRRETFRIDQGYDGSRYGERAVAATGGAKTGGTAASTLGSSNGRLTGKSQTIGWRANCACLEFPVPAKILDPFGGAGTTGLVADRLGRNATLIELNPAYRELASVRIEDDAPLFAKII